MRSIFLTLLFTLGVALLAPNVAFAASTCGGYLNSTYVQGTCYSGCPSGMDMVGHCADASTPICCVVTPVTAKGDVCKNKYKGVCTPSAECFTSIGASDCNAPEDTCCTVTASTSTKGSPTTLTNPLGANTTFFDIIQRVIRTFLGFVGALALLVFIYAGITWMTAGSSDRIQKAKDSMKYAVIGLALIVFSYAITNFFFRTLGGG